MVLVVEPSQRTSAQPIGSSAKKALAYNSKPKNKSQSPKIVANIHSVVSIVAFVFGVRSYRALVYVLWSIVFGLWLKMYLSRADHTYVGRLSPAEPRRWASAKKPNHCIDRVFDSEIKQRAAFDAISK